MMLFSVMLDIPFSHHSFLTELCNFSRTAMNNASMSYFLHNLHFLHRTAQHHHPAQRNFYTQAPFDPPTAWQGPTSPSL